MGDGTFEGCRCCLARHIDLPSFDYQEYGNQFVPDSNHQNLKIYGNESKIHKTASLLKCNCNKAKKRKRASQRMQENKNKKSKKLKMSVLRAKELPNYNAMSKRRKPSKRGKSAPKREANNGCKYDYFGGAKVHNLRGNDRKRKQCVDA